MRYLIPLVLFAAALPAQQSVAKRDSTVADSLNRMAPRFKSPSDRRKLDSLAAVLRTPVVPPALPPAPSAVFVAMCNGLTCNFDGRASTGSRITYAWTCGAAPGCGTLTSALIAFTYPATGTYSATLTVTDSLGRKSAVTKAVSVTAAPPPTAPDTTLVSRLLGSPVAKSLAAFAARGIPFSTFADAWTGMGEQRWLTDGAQWDASNYYDRAQQFYALWTLSGDAKWKDRADQIALSYRNQYWAAQAAPYQYNTSSYWSMPGGVALHYAATGDTASKNAVGYAAGWLTSDYGYQRLATHAEMENRWRSRMLQIAVLAHAVAAPLTGPWVGQVIAAPGATWRDKAGNILTEILRAQAADGGFHDDQSCGYVKPFMDALLADAMIQYTQLVGPDARVLPAVTRMLEYDWNRTWDPTSRSFFYYEGECTRPEGSGGRYPAPDLTGMLVHGFAWVSAQSGSAVWRARADTVFAASVSGAYLQGSKQFNQMFMSTWRAIPLLPPVQAPPPPPSDTGAFTALFGPTPSSAKVRAAGGSFLQYEDNFVTFDEQQWATNGATWANMNYYDRALIWYAWYRRTGDAKYLSRANALALDYRQNYLEPNNYAIQAHWSMMDGLAAHFLATGDTMSKIAVGKVADLFIGLTYRDNIGTKTATDNRVQARYLTALLLANSIKAPSLGIGSPVGIPGGHDWAAELRRALTLILGTQDADGAWRLSDCGDGGSRVVHPFTTGLLMDALGRYYDTFEADARIPGAIKRAADYLWATQWVAAGVTYTPPGGTAQVSPGAFKYIERVCPTEGGPGLAPDLNNLINTGFVWTFRKTGDATYKTRAIAIFNGAVAGAWISPAKQFNEVYSSSWRALPDLIVP